MAENILELTDETFPGEVERSAGLTIVDFWAEWCGPCKAIAPVMEELAREYNGKAKFAKLDVDAHPHTPQRYGIRSIPSILFFKAGKLAETVVGAVPKNHLKKKVEEYLV